VSLTGLAIADAVPADVEAIMACERQPGYEDTVGRWSREEHLAGLADATHRYFISRDAQGNPGGFVMLQKIDVPAESVLIRRIATIKQGQGHGAALLAHALDFILENCAPRRLICTSGPTTRAALPFTASSACGTTASAMTNVTEFG
jgi:GNAT superfamily N-acetyltransferase